MIYVIVILIKYLIIVEVLIGCAFEVFMCDFGVFKLLEYNLFGVLIVEMIFELFVGGYFYDCGIDGSECCWVWVLVYELFGCVLFIWNIGLMW